jgi:hypothetical protein
VFSLETDREVKAASELFSFTRDDDYKYNDDDEYGADDSGGVDATAHDGSIDHGNTLLSKNENGNFNVNNSSSLTHAISVPAKEEEKVGTKGNGTTIGTKAQDSTSPMNASAAVPTAVGAKDVTPTSSSSFGGFGLGNSGGNGGGNGGGEGGGGKTKAADKTLKSFAAASVAVCPSQRVFAFCGGENDARIAGNRVMD